MALGRRLARCNRGAGQSGTQIALELLAREITKATRLFNFPGRGPNAETVMLTLLLSPPVARSLAAAGYSKHDVKKHILPTEDSDEP